MASDTARRDGTISFDGGCDSISVTTVSSAANPNGLQRNELAWMINCTCRDGGLSPRGGWLFRKMVWNNEGLHQGQFIYSPVGANPYLIVAISGNILKVDLETYDIRNLSVEFGEFMPATETYYFYVQAEEFLVIQAGDGTTLPLIWNNVTLRRSIGITNTAVAPGTPGINEIPAATAMSYFAGRLWYVQNKTINAGDIVGGTSGTAAFNFRDSVLNVTENPLVVGGDGFSIGSNDGTLIRGLAYSASINEALGQGRLFAGTRKAIYALDIPITRTAWIAADNANQPLITVVQLVNGWVNDRSIVPVNGDLFSQSLEPSIRSLVQSVRNFQQWGQTEISANENRILQFNDRSLLRFATGIFFSNRLLQSALPRQTPQGVVHDAVIPLDFTPISTFGATLQPNWEGSQEGIPIFQMSVADFGGRERAFAFVRSEVDHSLQLWEIMESVPTNRFDNVDNRIVFQFETPAFTWDGSIGGLELKELVGAELWWDRMFGSVEVKVEYRPDSATCYLPWHEFTDCSPANTAESVHVPVGYPVDLGPCYKATVSLPRPDPTCAPCNAARPANVGYQFQFRITIKGYVRVRGLWFWANPVQKGLYQNLAC